VFPVRYEHHLHIKSKAIPVTGSGGPYCETSRLPHCLDNRLTAAVVSLRAGRALLSRHNLWYSFLLEVQ
jgi:hypothetical protein